MCILCESYPFATRPPESALSLVSEHGLEPPLLLMISETLMDFESSVFTAWNSTVSLIFICCLSDFSWQAKLQLTRLIIFLYLTNRSTFATCNRQGRALICCLSTFIARQKNVKLSLILLAVAQTLACRNCQAVAEETDAFDHLSLLCP